MKCTIGVVGVGGMGDVNKRIDLSRRITGLDFFPNIRNHGLDNGGDHHPEFN